MRWRPVVLFDPEDLSVGAEAFEAEDANFAVGFAIQQNQILSDMAFAVATEIQVQIVVFVLGLQGEVFGQCRDDFFEFGVEDFTVTSFLFAPDIFLKG